jgi:hypothetical protein
LTANHVHVVALCALFYSYARTHSKFRMTPAMQAEIAATFTSFVEVLARIDVARAPKLRGPYEQRVA